MRRRILLLPLCLSLLSCGLDQLEADSSTTSTSVAAAATSPATIDPTSTAPGPAQKPNSLIGSVPPQAVRWSTDPNRCLTKATNANTFSFAPCVRSDLQRFVINKDKSFSVGATTDCLTALAQNQPVEARPCGNANQAWDLYSPLGWIDNPVGWITLASESGYDNLPVKVIGAGSTTNATQFLLDAAPLTPTFLLAVVTSKNPNARCLQAGASAPVTAPCDVHVQSQHWGYSPNNTLVAADGRLLARDQNQNITLQAGNGPLSTIWYWSNGAIATRANYGSSDPLLGATPADSNITLRTPDFSDAALWYYYPLP